MFDDRDIKIAGSHPSQEIRKTPSEEDVSPELRQAMADGDIERARRLGERMAQKLLAADEEKIFSLNESADLLQRRNLLAFTATTSFDRFCKNRTIAAVAYGAFYDHVKRCSEKTYFEMSDTGIFSFYYLALRRGGDVERRMGQTFAMLCGKDGDPVYQEVGEAVYCSFSAEIRAEIQAMGL